MLLGSTGAELRLSFRLEVEDPLELTRLELLTLGAPGSLGDTRDEALVDMDELRQIHQDLGLRCSQLGGADRSGPLAEIDLGRDAAGCPTSMCSREKSPNAHRGSCWRTAPRWRQGHSGRSGTSRELQAVMCALGQNNQLIS